MRCRSVVCLLLIFICGCLTIIISGCAGHFGNGAPPIEKKAGQIVSGAREYARGGKIGLWADGSTGEVWIQNTEGEKVWTSYPEITDNIYDFASEARRNAILSVYAADNYNNQNLVSSYSESVQHNGLTLEALPNGVIMYFDFPEESEQFMIPVRFTLQDERLTAEILFDSIYTYGFVTINTVDLMPYFGAATREDEGYMFVPDGSGALIRYDESNKEADIYSQPLYGRNPALTPARQLETVMPARLPVYGVNKNGKAFIAVAVQGDCEAAVVAGQPGKLSVFSNVNFSFTYTQRDVYTIADKDVNAQTVYKNADQSSRTNPVVTYIFLGQNTGYVGMAQAFRGYLLETCGFERTDQTDLQLYLEIFGGAQQSKTFLGIPYKKLQIATTFNDVRSVIEDVTSAYKGQLNVILQGFQKKGMYKSNEDGLFFDNAFGGQKGFEQICDYAAGKGAVVYPAVDFINDYKSKTSQAARMISGNSIKMGFIQPVTGLQKTEKTWNLRIPGLVKEKAEQFIDGFSAAEGCGLYLHDMGHMVYSDYSVRSPILRDDTKDIITGILKKAKGKSATNGGNLYAVRYASKILHAPETASKFIIETEEVPFYQIAMHGLCGFAGAPINEDENPEDAFLRCISLGYSLNFRLTKESSYVLKQTDLNYLFGTEYSAWKEDIARMSSRISDLRGLGNQFITAYIREDSVAVTTYENGVKVYVNFGTKPVVTEGHTIPEKNFLRVDS